MVKECNMIDAKDIIGVYAICNTGSILVHKIDYAEDRVLVSLNGENKEWCALQEGRTDDSEEYETGFYWGKMFIPLAEVYRFY